MKSVLLTYIIFFTTIVLCKAQVAEKAEDISPLMISEKVPSIQVTSLNGETHLLTDIVKEKRSILLFYRGGWCPYCNAHLSAVGQVENEILELEYQVIAISPDSPENLKNTLDKEKLNYALYSDGDGALIKAMGLAFKASDRQQVTSLSTSLSLYLN
jgi:peroxiredoxin